MIKETIFPIVMATLLQVSVSELQEAQVAFVEDYKAEEGELWQV